MNHVCIAGIVTFNPELDLLKRNVDRIVNQVDYVFIVDNGSRNEHDIRKIVENYENITIIANGKNLGIAYAMNQIGDKALEMDYPYFLTLDQDSVADEDMVEKLLELFANGKVGGVSPYINVNGHFLPRNTVEKLKIVISSGFIVRTNLWKDIGGFWDYLFIDEVDHEFCFQIQERGFSILRRYDTSIEHRIGESCTKIILGHEYKLTNHSAFRRYYITRNNIIMRHLFKKEKNGCYAHLYQRLFKLVISIIICEKDKVAKIWAIIWGIIAGWGWCVHNRSIKERRILIG